MRSLITLSCLSLLYDSAVSLVNRRNMPVTDSSSHQHLSSSLTHSLEKTILDITDCADNLTTP